LKENPNEFKTEKILPAPPGMPIGQEEKLGCDIKSTSGFH
jgi:hypothetical protein